MEGRYVKNPKIDMTHISYSAPFNQKYKIKSRGMKKPTVPVLSTHKQWEVLFYCMSYTGS